MTMHKARYSGLYYPQDRERLLAETAVRPPSYTSRATLPTALLLPHASWQYLLDPLHEGLAATAHLAVKQILLLAPIHQRTEALTPILPKSDGLLIDSISYRYHTALRDRLADRFSFPQDDQVFGDESCWELLLPLISSYHPTAELLPILSGPLNAKAVKSYAGAIAQAVAAEEATLCIITTNANPRLTSPLAEEAARATLAFLHGEGEETKHACNSSALRAVSQQRWYSGKAWKILSMYTEGQAYQHIELDERDAHVWQITALLE